MDNDQAQLLGEIHATLKKVDERLDSHLKDDKKYKEKIDEKISKIEKRQLFLFLGFGGAGTAFGATLDTILKKLHFF